MAVPETGGYDQAFAVNNSRVARDFDCGGWPNGKNTAPMYKDRTVFDWRFSRRGINLGVNQSEVRAKTEYARRERPDKKEGEDTTDSHASNIRQEARDCSSKPGATDFSKNQNSRKESIVRLTTA
ncbi:MAG TPA: hypothetical protein VNX60_00055 [Candidatus Acidoferrum sp.]|nr:hypothetical protein [Candidatus Acidoferrum sp.]